MALSVTHTFVSAIPDDADTSLVRPSDWNAAHAVTGTVDNAALDDMAANTIKGRLSTGGDPQDLTGTQATTLLDTFTTSLKGLAPSSGGGSTNFLCADGTWTVPPAGTPGGSSGQVQYNNSNAFGGFTVGGDATLNTGTGALTIANDAVTYAKFQNISATARFIGRITSGSGDAEELTGTQATTLLDAFTTSLKGLAPASGGGTTNFLRADGTWTTVTSIKNLQTKRIFFPTDNEPPASNYATFDTRNSHPVLDFDDTTAEAAVFTGILPTTYNSGGITVEVAYSMTSATTGTAGFTVEIERIGDSQQDIDSDSFASAQTITAVTVPGTSGFVDVISVAITDGANMDSLAAGEQYRIRIKRDVANDTATGDAELNWVSVRET